MARLSRFGAVALVVGFIALHLPFLPASLEDLDSINFALGVRDFDVANHQPHPPGYPVFVFAAKLVHLFVPSEAHALALLGILAGGLTGFALVALFRELERDRAPTGRPLAAACLAMTSPLFFLTAARPLSDVMGLAVAVAVQAVVLRAPSPRALAVGALVAAIGIGIRSQVAWLAIPALVLAVLRQPRSTWGRVAAEVLVGLVAGAAIWAIPLVMLTGGPAGYLRTLFSQGAEDFTGVVMLWTTPTPRQLVRVLVAAFVSPWSFVPVAVIVLTLAAAGFIQMLWRDRRPFALLVVLFGPYVIFDLVFQEAATTRYALPIVIPIAFAAARGAWLLTPAVAVPGLAALAGFNLFVTVTALSGYASVDAPAFRLLEDMRQRALQSPAPVLAMHRRDDLDLRRPIVWVGDRMPSLDRRLAAPPKHEWLELVKYWNGGGRQPVWFVADPPRSDLALFKPVGKREQYRWPFELPSVMGGVRPNEMDWYVIDPPDWYLGQGWDVTPETAGVSREDVRGPGRGGIEGWIRRWPQPSTLMIGGRNLGGPPARVTVAVDDRVVDETTVPSGFFLRMVQLPAFDSGSEPASYARVAVSSDQNQVAIEQFDVQPAGRVVFGYGDGWNEQEYNPATGRLWRWSTERSTLRVIARSALTLSLAGEIEEASTSHVTIRVGERVVHQQDIGRTFSIVARVPSEAVSPAETAITIESSAWYVPAERRWRSQDRRHLGLKIYSCELVPAS